MITTTAVTHTEGEVVAMLPQQVVVTPVATGSRHQAVVVEVVAATIRQTIHKAAMATIRCRVGTSWQGLSRMLPTMAHRPMVLNMAHRIPAMAMVRHRLGMDHQCTVTECPRPTQAMVLRLLDTGHRLAAATMTAETLFHPGGNGASADRA